MNLQDIKEEARKELDHIVYSGKVEIEDAPGMFLAMLDKYIDHTAQATRERDVEVVKDWFTKAPKYRTKDSLIKALRTYE